MSVQLSLILPCQNEELALAKVLRQAQKVFARNALETEILVSDSSTDKSAQIATSFGAQVVSHHQPGYGTAIMLGVHAARGKVLVIADADGTYDMDDIPLLLNELQSGADLVMGNRMKKMSPKAMSWLHRHVGNPFLSGLIRILFGSKLQDAQSGLRVLKKKTFDDLQLKSTGMEFASEMVIRACQQNLKIVEVPIRYRRRLGRSKLRRMRDGFRHLRLIGSCAHQHFIS